MKYVRETIPQDDWTRPDLNVLISPQGKRLRLGDDVYMWAIDRENDSFFVGLGADLYEDLPAYWGLFKFSGQLYSEIVREHCVRESPEALLINCYSVDGTFESRGRGSPYRNALAEAIYENGWALAPGATLYRCVEGFHPHEGK